MIVHVLLACLACPSHLSHLVAPSPPPLLTLPSHAIRLRGGSSVPSGPPRMQMKYVKRGTGLPLPSTPCVVFYNYKGYLTEGKRVFNNTFGGNPATAMVDERGRTHGCHIKAIESALKRMRCGDRVLVKAEHGCAFGTRGSQDGLVPPNATVTLEIELLRFGGEDILKNGKGSILLSYITQWPDVLANGTVVPTSPEARHSSFDASVNWKTPFSTNLGDEVDVRLTYIVVHQGRMLFKSLNEETFTILRSSFPDSNNEIYKNDLQDQDNFQSPEEKLADQRIRDSRCPDEFKEYLLNHTGTRHDYKELSGRLPHGIALAIGKELVKGSISRITVQREYFNLAYPDLPYDELEFYVELVDWDVKLELFQSDKLGAVNLKIIGAPLSFLTHIQDLSIVTLVLHGSTSAGHVFMPARNFTVIIGDGDLGGYIEDALVHLKEGQHAVIDISGEIARSVGPSLKPLLPELGQSEHILWECQIFNVKPSWSMEFEDLMRHVKIRRERGNEFFTSGEYEKADSFYESAFDLLLCEEGDGSREHRRIVGDERALLLTNRATVCYKRAKYNETIAYCSQALAIRTNMIKAKFRRAQANLELGHYEEAERDCRSILEIEPENQAATRLTLLVSEKQKEAKTQTAQFCVRAMGNAGKKG